MAKCFLQSLSIEECLSGSSSPPCLREQLDNVYVHPSKSPFSIHKLASEAAQPIETWFLTLSENNNLCNEYSPLVPDVFPSIHWVDAALGEGSSPDAANLWLGTDQSTTALHRDGYENIYCQIIGQKHFVLLPPVEAACVNEQWLLPATYDESMRLMPDEGAEKVPCAVWNPDSPEKQATMYSRFSKPMKVTLHEGDMMYLPTCW
ncbi:MAG: hypothetical protein Q9164_000292 [Protoblastenia rupestris]